MIALSLCGSVQRSGESNGRMCLAITARERQYLQTHSHVKQMTTCVVIDLDKLSLLQ